MVKAICATGYELSIWVDAMATIDVTALKQHIVKCYIRNPLLTQESPAFYTPICSNNSII